MFMVPCVAGVYDSIIPYILEFATLLHHMLLGGHAALQIVSSDMLLPSASSSHAVHMWLGDWPLSIQAYAQQFSVWHELDLTWGAAHTRLHSWLPRLLLRPRS